MEEKLQLEAFVWRGQTRYRCPECRFDGPTVADVVKHHSKLHQTPQEGAGPVLFGADDRPIDRTTVKD